MNFFIEQWVPHSKWRQCGLCAFFAAQGMPAVGVVEKVFRRGVLLVDEGRFRDFDAHGLFLAREPLKPAVAN